MAEKAKKYCDEPGCGNVAWQHMKCWKHHPTHVAKREAKLAEAKPVSETIDESGSQQQSMAATDPVATDHEHHVVNLLELFKSKQAAELEAFSGKLSQLVNPIERLTFALQAVQI